MPDHMTLQGSTHAPHMPERDLHARNRQAFRSQFRHVTTGQRNETNVHDGVGAPWFFKRPEDSEKFPIFHIEHPGRDLVHPVSPEEIRDRIFALPEGIQARIRDEVHHICLPHVNVKQEISCCYGLHWGSSVYLYPVHKTGMEMYSNHNPAALREAAKFGAKLRWLKEERMWKCQWTQESIRNFYLENVLLHELGHAIDDRNNSSKEREAYANAFAQKYGNPPKRFKGKKLPHNERKNRQHG